MAQRDHPSVARSYGSLSAAERDEFAALIEHRHSFQNLVLMCGVHSDLIDDPAQAFSVDRVIEIKREHEASMDRYRRSAITRSAASPSSPDDTPRALDLTTSDAPAWARKALKALATADPDGLAWLRRETGDSSDAPRLADLIERWPLTLNDGSDELVNAVIRQAEAAGLWRHAATAWERLGHRYEAVQRADTFARAAVDAGVAGDVAMRERLLNQAEALDPDGPRARLERLDDRALPEDKLVVLAELESDNPELAALILCHRARAELLLEKLDSATEHLQAAQDLAATSFAVRMLSINLRVQRGRVALRDDQDFSLAEIMTAMSDGVDLRAELIAMRRWSESVRLLMLVADVPLLLRDPEWGREVLAEALPEEITAEDGAEVLGDAALRAGDAALALRVTEDAARTDGVRRIRATAHVDLPAMGRRAAALAELEQLATGAGDEAVHSAFARLSGCLPPVRADWHHESAEVLAKSPHRDVERSLRVLSKAAKGDALSAEAEAAGLPEEAWAAEVRLRVAASRGRRPGILAAAEGFLRFHPDASGRLLAGRALKDAAATDRAIELLRMVAHDLNAAPRIRADAFHELLEALAEERRWAEADRSWQVWRELSLHVLHRPDGRVAGWQARLLLHGGGQVP